MESFRTYEVWPVDNVMMFFGKYLEYPHAYTHVYGNTVPNWSHVSLLVF